MFQKSGQCIILRAKTCIMLTTDQKIELLRGAMRREGISAYLVPSADPHQSEYVADHWKGREWLSGFTGSSGILVVTMDHAGLWTDSRYFLQAEAELAGSCIILQRQVIPHAPEHVQWLSRHLPKGATVGLDGNLFSLGQLRYLAKFLHPCEIDIRSDVDLLEEIWTDRPPLPNTEVLSMEKVYGTESRDEKIARLRQEITSHGADSCLITTLDDIAWLLNIRASDVEYNPVCISSLVVNDFVALWFVDSRNISEDLSYGLLFSGVVLRPYDALAGYLATTEKEKRILVDTASVNVRLYQAIQEGCALHGDNICAKLKGVKTVGEIQQLRRAMRKDGVALTRLMRWLEASLPGQTITEFAVGEKIAELRSDQGEYFGESFGAIVGYQSNGAIVHYRPHPQQSAILRNEGILLLDCGGQYFHGTTDITRTIALGTPNDAQKQHFTAVLQGHIALADAQFPKGTKGIQLDILARMPLWRLGKNYGHGTGHGVGYFLNVHEGPQGISATPGNSKSLTDFVPGMVTSNEPGYYEEGAYGMRVENLILCVEVPGTDGQFLRFETLTLFPIDRQLIAREMLNEREIQWIDQYHETVFRELSPLLEPEEVQWLSRQCARL